MATANTELGQFVSRQDRDESERLQSNYFCTNEQSPVSEGKFMK